MIEQATVSLTPQAMSQLRSLLAQENNPQLGLRVFVSGGHAASLRAANYAQTLGIKDTRAVSFAFDGAEAQRMQFECGPRLDLLAERCGGLCERDLVQTAPVLDLLQSRHDRLYSRLFQS